MAAKKERVRRFLLDLTSLEVNTIVTADITGESMGDPREAIEDLRSANATTLGTIAGTLDTGEAAEGPGEESVAAPPVRSSRSLSFKDQARKAEALLESHATALSDNDQHHLSRICRHCRDLDRLAGKLDVQKPQTESIQQRPAAGGDDGGEATSRLEPEDMLTLRKMWELRAHPIAMQTVVQAGGDIITRIHPDYVGDRGSALLDLHRTGISTATEVWRSLVDTAVMILEKLADR